MYCPRCGQQQISEEVRFCPRCGLSLAAVPALLTMGEAAAAKVAGAGAVGRPRKRAGIRRGAKLLFFSVVLAPIFFGVSIAADSPGPLIVPLTVFLAGLAWMLYFVLFGEEVADAAVEQDRREVGAARGAQALPPSTFVPASGFGRQGVHTADMARPPSVTEQTTKLLDED